MNTDEMILSIQEITNQVYTERKTKQYSELLYVVSDLDFCLRHNLGVKPSVHNEYDLDLFLDY